MKSWIWLGPCISAILFAMMQQLNAAEFETKRPKLRSEFSTLGTVPTTSPTHVEIRPVLRPNFEIRPQIRAQTVPTQVFANNKTTGLRQWVARFRARAAAERIGRSTFDRAFADVKFLEDVIKRDRNQSEFTKSIWDYLDSAVSQSRIENGRKNLRKYRSTLDAIEARYGVEKEVVAAIWGLESAYGKFRGSTPIISALATLAYDGRRGKFFEEQLIAALKILQNGDIPVSRMTGSWAGAMGHTQFIPTSYLAYAEDFDRDGKRNIWSDNPADALASTAAYLARSGWVKGMPWGVEVRLPAGFDYALANRRVKKTPSKWAGLGVSAARGGTITNYGPASILLPAGARGPALMIFKNFKVIERYNAADAYVIGVGHLSDRLKRGPGFRASWPRSDRALSFSERKEMQQRLTRRGFDTQGVDGRVGPNTINAIRKFQRSISIVPDGYASMNLLRQLR